MPKQKTIEEIKNQLPPFVKIYEETYKGARYKAKFLDLEYEEEFEANVKAVITLQHGCKSRSNNRRSKNVSISKRNGIFSLEDFKKIIPPYIYVYDDTWKGLTKEVKVRDIEYNIDFTIVAASIKRSGRCYCEERRRAEFIKRVTIPAEEIQNRINKIYGTDIITMIPETYSGTNKMADFIIKGKGRLRHSVLHVLSRDILKSGRLLTVWRNQILEKWGFKCAISGEEEKLEAHHIKPRYSNQDLILDLNNGIPLTHLLHKEFHRKYGPKFNNVYQLIEFGDEKGVDLRPRLKELNGIEINSIQLPMPFLESLDQTQA